MRVVFDTDVMVAATRSAMGASRALLVAAADLRIQLLVSPALLLEYECVLKREEHLAAASARSSDIDVLLDMVAAFAEPVRLNYLWRPQLSDVGDELVLEAAVNGRADFLVSFNAGDFELGASRFGLTVCRPVDCLRRI